MTYAESAALMNDTVFRGRVKVALLNYAQYLSLQLATASSNAKMVFIQQTIRNLEVMTQTVVPPTVMNPNVQQDGADISDANLQAAVQAVADLMM